MRQSDEREDMTMTALFGIGVTPQHHNATTAQYNTEQYSTTKNKVA